MENIVYFCSRNDIIGYGNDTIIKRGEGSPQRVWPYTGGPCYEIGGWPVLCAQSGARETITKDG